MRVERRFQKGFPSLDGIFAFLGQFVEDERLGSDLEFSITLLVEEIFTNMVRHNTASRNDILIGIERDGEQVVVQLTDFDVDPFDPESVEEVDVEAPLAERRPGGLGLHLVKSLADKVVFEYDDRDLRVVVYKKVS